MGFLDQLRANNAPVAPPMGQQPTLGISPTNPLESTISAIEPFINRMRNRNMSDQKDMMLWQNIHQPGGMPGPENARIRQVTDPNNTAGMNTVFDPGITNYQRATLGQGQQQIDLEKGKLATANRVGDEKLALQGERLKLDTEKNQNIYDTKQRELEQKIRDSDRDAAIARERIAAGENTAIMRDQLQRSLDAARDARHQLDLGLQRQEFETKYSEAQARIRNLDDQIAGRAAGTTTTRDVTQDDATGDQRSVTVTGRNPTPGASGNATPSNAPKTGVPGWKYVPKPGGGWTAVEDK